MDRILHYFPYLLERQIKQLELLFPLYKEWNQKINVISRKDMDFFYLHHVLHSMSLGMYVNWKNGTKVLDLGCGGGFPGIPLAILFPQLEFTLIDGTSKKIKVVQSVIEALKIENARAVHARAEEHPFKYHYIVSRAVAPLSHLMEWSTPLLLHKSINALPNGLIAYKGGDLKEEMDQIRGRKMIDCWPLKEKLTEPYFDTKFLVYVS